MSELTVLCWLWRGWRPVYDVSHVNALARMLRAHLSLPYRLVCITDQPAGITECATFPFWGSVDVTQRKPQNCYSRLRLFDPAVGRVFGDRLLSIDLDCVLLGDLAPLLTDHDFRAVRGISAPLNGSMYLLRAGTHSWVWTSWDASRSPAVIAAAQHNGRRLGGSDQAWMSLQVPRAATWGPEHGVLQFSELAAASSLQDARAVFFAGRIKPWSPECRQRLPHLYDSYSQWID